MVSGAVRIVDGIQDDPTQCGESEYPIELAGPGGQCTCSTNGVCNRDDQCSAGEACIDGGCVAGACNTDSQCGETGYCAFHSCVAGGCRDDSTCGEGNFCASDGVDPLFFDHRCHPKLPVGGFCSANHFCQSNHCTLLPGTGRGFCQ